MPSSGAVMSDEDDTDCAFSMCKGVEKENKTLLVLIKHCGKNPILAPPFSKVDFQRLSGKYNLFRTRNYLKVCDETKYNV